MVYTRPARVGHASDHPARRGFDRRDARSRRLHRSLAAAQLVFLASLAGCNAIEEASDELSEEIRNLGQPCRSSPSPECDPPRKRSAKTSDACCFDSFYKAKKYLHAHRVPTRAGHQWHHIVGQHSANTDKFGAHDLHCTDNLVYLDREKHQRVSGHYMRVQAATSGKRFYQWLAPKSFDEQYRIGMEVLKQYGGSPP